MPSKLKRSLKSIKPNSIVMFLGDTVALGLAFLLGYMLSDQASLLLDRTYQPFDEGFGKWLAVFTVAIVTSQTLYLSQGHYTQRTPWWEQVKFMLRVNVILFLIAASVFYSLKVPFSRLWVLMSFAFALPLLMIGRLVVRMVLLKMKRWAVDVTLIGGPQNVLESLFALNSDSYNTYNVRSIGLLGTTNLLAKADLPDRQKNCTQSLISADKLEGYIRDSKCDIFIFAPDETTRLDMQSLTRIVHQKRRQIGFVPSLTGMSLYGMDVQHFFGSHTVLLRPKRHVEKIINRIFKRALDVVGAICGLMVLAIPMAIIGWYIRRDGGPVLYYQMRVGMHGKPFKCWKLRSMVANAEEVLQTLLANDPQARKEWDTDFKLKNDPRITRIGHFIRKTSFDELPQLFNVLKGEMSLVGPRPIVAKELDYYGKHQDDYLAAKPGLTGLWQVSGRNDTSYAYRVYLDSWYVTHWSLWTDIVIIFKTVGILVSRKGAY